MDSISKAMSLAKSNIKRSPVALREEEEKNIRYSKTRNYSIREDVLKENRLLSESSDKRVVDAFRLLRTRVMSRMQQNQWNTLGITSCRPNEGKSLTAINLAISIAMRHNYTVMMVDTDLRRPSIHSFFGITPKYGLADYLIRDVPIEEVLVHPGIERFVMLPSGGSLDAQYHSSEYLASPKMAQLVDELKTRYPSRLVLFDLPPILIGDDVVAFSTYLDAIMLVVEDGKTREGELAHALDLVSEVEVIGTVLNKSDELTQDNHYQGYY
ncbi:MAG: CpsD/CapB family tyrosine-protein kinase [Pseudomonadota bacterium]|nr:CpsD/CapB family tyrosine-protein kinase [Pseudomonadota bacterium]